MYELRDKLCDEMDEVARKPKMGAGDLELAHKLTDTIKNIDMMEHVDAMMDAAETDEQREAVRRFKKQLESR